MQEKTHTESQRHRDDLRLGLCPRLRKRANRRQLTGVRGMGDCAEEALLRREDSAIAEPEGCSSIREPHLQIIYIFLPITSDKITGFYRIDRIFLILNPVNHDNPVILSKKHKSYPHLHSRAQRGRWACLWMLSMFSMSHRTLFQLRHGNLLNPQTKSA